MHRVLTGEAEEARARPGRPPRLTIHVLATTMAGTRAALKTASILAQGLDVRIVLLVPHAVPYGESLECPSRRAGHSAERFHDLASECGDDVLLRIVVCRPDLSHLESLLPRDATLLVGIRERRLWRSREERLARTFAVHGHRVLMIGAQPSHGVVISSEP